MVPSIDFTPRERRLIARLSTPNQVQRYLNRLPYNQEPHGRATLRSFRGVVREGCAHCLEAALFAAVVLEQHGYPPIVLSFDDGYQSVREVAIPLLRRFGYPSVLFVPTDYIGGYNTFDDGVEPQERHCDWNDLRELARAGVSIQSHGVSHKTFSVLTLSEIEQELLRSKALLENNVGGSVEVMAFPYGDDGGNWHDIPLEHLPPRFRHVRLSDHTTTYRRLDRAHLSCAVIRRPSFRAAFPGAPCAIQDPCAA